MTQIEKTENDLSLVSACEWADGPEDIARALARKLDAVSDIVFHPFHSATLEDWQAIRAIIEADQ